MSRVNIPNGSITTVRLANDAVVSSKIKEGAVRTEHLADGAVTNAKISLITPVKTSNDTTPATTEYVKTLIDDLVDSAPGSLDTLNEIALALNNDANLGSALTTAIASSVSAETAARVSAVSAETAARASADSVISAAVSAETAARVSAVSAEAAARVSAVSAEAAARASADSVISAAVSAEAAARASAVSAEAYARESADSVISAAVSAEAAARASADSVISAAVSAEAYARESAITSAVSAEAAARASADSVISAAVSAEAYARESADAAISAAVSAEAVARASDVSAEVINRNTAISAAVSAEVIDRNTAISDAITSLVAGTPSALDTLNEIASALNNDDNLASTLTNLIGSVSAAVSTETVARESADSVISAAVSAEVDARASAITSEAYARESADSVISAAVSAEAYARESADSVISAAVSAEAYARESADSVISAAVSAEAAARASADSVISAAVSAESYARESADSVISAAVSAESDARESADSVISAAVSAEAANRATAITSAVSAEAVARESADSVISAAVSAETYARESADSVISAAVSAEVDARASADSVISAAVSAEVDARASAITSAVSVETAARTSAITSAVSVETAARTSAITSAVSVETAARESADSVISAAVSAETVARASAITSAVSAETAARASAITSAVSVETAARASAITSAVSAETAARASALSVLYDRFTQRGADIDGEAASDNSGYSVSLSADGSIIAIGATGNDGNGSNSGHVRVYEYNGTSWVQRGTDIDGEAAGDQNGSSVSISADGSIVAIGATYNAGNGSNSGHVRVYEYNGTSWVQRGADIDGEAANDTSGFRVSLSADGSIVAIGARGNDSYRGHVRVYEYNGTSWVQRGADIDGEAAGDNSGYSVSLSANGSIVAIGAIYNDGNVSNSGHVRVYEYNGTSWVQRGADIDGESEDDSSGLRVSLSADGSIVAIGTIYNDGNGTNSGHVRVYEYNGTSWVQRGADINGEAAFDQSGSSVSLSADGSIVAIGANANANYRGHVRIYKWNGTIWVQRGADIDGEAAGDQSGSSVSISADGSIVAIGATYNDGNGTNSGHVRVYEFNENVQTQIDTISAAVSAEAVARASAISSAISGIATIDYVVELGLNNRDIVIGTVSSATNLNTNTPTYDASGNHTIIFSFRTKDLGINYSYYVYYALQTDPGAVTLVSTINGIEDVNSISIGQLTPNTTYILSVIIFNNDRAMQISVSARTLEYTTPSAP